MATAEDRLAELILYIARESEGDKAFGKAKLNRLLFFVDFGAYLELGQAITGRTYIKQQNGPVPQQIEDVLTELQQHGRLAVACRAYHGHPQKRPLALVDPDLTLFTGPEVALVDRTIQAWWGKSAQMTSDLSHEFIGWKAADIGEPIPYETALLDDRPLTAGEIRRGLALIPYLVNNSGR